MLMRLSCYYFISKIKDLSIKLARELNFKCKKSLFVVRYFMLSTNYWRLGTNLNLNVVLNFI